MSSLNRRDILKVAGVAAGASLLSRLPQIRYELPPSSEQINWFIHPELLTKIGVSDPRLNIAQGTAKFAMPQYLPGGNNQLTLGELLAPYQDAKHPRRLPTDQIARSSPVTQLQCNFFPTKPKDRQSFFKVAADVAERENTERLPFARLAEAIQASNLPITQTAMITTRDGLYYMWTDSGLTQYVAISPPDGFPDIYDHELLDRGNLKIVFSDGRQTLRTQLYWQSGFGPYMIDESIAIENTGLTPTPKDRPVYQAGLSSELIQNPNSIVVNDGLIVRFTPVRNDWEAELWQDDHFLPPVTLHNILRHDSEHPLLPEVFVIGSSICYFADSGRADTDYGHLTIISPQGEEKTFGLRSRIGDLRDAGPFHAESGIIPSHLNDRDLVLHISQTRAGAHEIIAVNPNQENPVTELAPVTIIETTPEPYPQSGNL